MEVPGKNAAVASLVCGILSIVCWIFSITSILSLILGIVGLVQASKAKKAGYNDGLRTAGFVVSLVGLIFGALIFLNWVFWIGLLGVAGGMGLVG